MGSGPDKVRPSPLAPKLTLRLGNEFEFFAFSIAGTRIVGSGQNMGRNCGPQTSRRQLTVRLLPVVIRQSATICPRGHGDCEKRQPYWAATIIKHCFLKSPGIGYPPPGKSRTRSSASRELRDFGHAWKLVNGSKGKHPVEA